MILSGCQPSAPETSRPHIVLISVDSLRPDHLACYGYGRPTSPTIDRLAREGALFETVTSSSSWTLPAHAALFTAQPDFVHGADRASRKLIPDRRTLAESLQAAGYRTVGIWSGPLLDPHFGFGQGFETYWAHRDGQALLNDAFDMTHWGQKDVLSHQDVTGPAILEKVDAALAEADDRPLFLFVHLWDVHYDFIPPAPYDSMFTDAAYDGPVDGRNVASYLKFEEGTLSPDDLRHLIALYDGEIAWTDSQIDQILQKLDAAGLGDETLVVITADHGEEFFEHGHFGHKRTLYDESIRIPWVMRYPGKIAPDQRITTPVRILDIAPTLIEWAGAEPLPATLGRPVQPLLEGESSYGAKATVAELAVGTLTGRPQLALRTDRYKLLVHADGHAAFALYDLTADPEELRNVHGSNAGLTAEAQTLLEATLEDLKRTRTRHARPQLGSGRLPEDIERELRSLGYLSGADLAANPIWADPNPIETCAGTPDAHLGTTTLSWDAPDAVGPVEIWVQPNNTEFASHDVIGSKTTGHWVADGMEFVLIDTHSGEELGRVKMAVRQIPCDSKTSE